MDNHRRCLSAFYRPVKIKALDNVTTKELAGGDVESYSRLPVTEQLVQLSHNFIQAIRKRPLTREILAWEMVERNELTIELESVRENTMIHGLFAGS
jgi:hypothetical protein